MGHRRQILILNNSYIHSVFSESLLSARPCAQCLKCLNEQKGHGLWSSLNKIFTSALSHSFFSLSRPLCSHSRNFESRLCLHPCSLYSFLASTALPLAALTPVPLPEEKAGVTDGSAQGLTVPVFVLVVVSGRCYYPITDRSHHL